jgi:hypothetical protein
MESFQVINNNFKIYVQYQHTISVIQISIHEKKLLILFYFVLLVVLKIMKNKLFLLFINRNSIFLFFFITNSVPLTTVLFSRLFLSLELVHNVNSLRYVVLLLIVRLNSNSNLT